MASIENDPDYLSRIFFSDESNFHVSSRVHRHNVRIWGEENPHVIRPHERDSPKLKVWAGMLEHRLIGPYFFHVAFVRQDDYFKMLKEFAYPTLRNRQPHSLRLLGHKAPWAVDWPRRAHTLASTFPGFDPT